MAQQESGERFEDAVELGDVIETLEALLDKGLSELPAGMSRAFERDDYAAALALARDRYAQDGPGRENALLYAVLLIYRGLCDEAAGVLRKALSISGNEQSVPLQLAQVLNLFVDGQQEAALGLLQGLRQISFPVGKWWGLMGSIYLELDETEEAASCYREALDRGAKDAEIAYRLSRLLWEGGERFDGASRLEQAARLGVSEVRLWALAAQAWSELEEWGKAVEAWSRVIRLEDDEEAWWLGYGDALRESGEHEGAARAYERVLRLDPFERRAQLELAHLQMERGFFEEAMQGYRKILKEDPEQVEALQGAAAVAFEQGDFEEAERYAQEAALIEPERADVHFNLGLIWVELGRHMEAIGELARAHELEPEEGAYTMRLALALLGAGRVEEAMKRVVEGLEQGCEPGELLEFVQRLMYRGEREMAQGFLERYGFDDAEWELVSPVMTYVLASGGGDEEGMRAASARFEGAVSRHEGVLPLNWDLEELDRSAQRLSGEGKKRAKQMIKRLVVG